MNGVRPNAVTVSSIPLACAELKDLNLGREIHGFVVKHAMEENVFVSSALVNVYASCLSIKQKLVLLIELNNLSREMSFAFGSVL